MVKKIILCLFFSAILSAQVQLGFSTGSAVRVNTAGARDITLTSASSPAAVQFTVAWTNMSGVGIALGPQASAAGKSISCAPSGASAISCLVVGINQTPIANGSIATVNFTALKTSSMTGTLSTVAVTGTIPPLSVTGGAIVIPTTGGAVSVPFSRAEDLNNDGKVDSQDLALFWQQMEPGGTCSTGDINGDGRCDVQDAQLIVLAALGLT